jgi:hypothetical protein
MLRTDRAGFALPMVILLIGFLTAGAMAAFARAGSESRAIDNQRAEQLALVTAARGLEQHLGAQGALIADTTYLYAADGSQRAVVRSVRVVKGATATDTSTYFISSEGRVRLGGDRSRPPATRTISILAYRVGNYMPVRSAWTSLTGLTKAGNSGDITGRDAGTCPDAVGDTVAGVLVPTKVVNASGDTVNGFDGQTGAFSGNPPIHNTMTVDEVEDAVGIDWIAMTDPTSSAYPFLNPTFTSCQTTSPNYVAGIGPCGAFPNEQQRLNWPVTMVNGDLDVNTISSSFDANGILIVTGDLRLNGNAKFRGIILVGGQMIDSGVSDVEGAVISGLNVLKGQDVGVSSIGQGTKYYKYNSCDVARAADSMARFERLANTRADNRWSF